MYILRISSKEAPIEWHMIRDILTYEADDGGLRSK